MNRIMQIMPKSCQCELQLRATWHNEHDERGGGASGRLIWTVDMVEAFSKSKAAMLNAAELAHPDSAAQLSLEVDASGLHVGAVLHQDIGEGR